MRQIKIIDKTKGYNLEMEKNQDLIKNLDKLKQYAENYNIFNTVICSFIRTQMHIVIKHIYVYIYDTRNKFYI